MLKVGWGRTNKSTRFGTWNIVGIKAQEHFKIIYLKHGLSKVYEEVSRNVLIDISILSSRVETITPNAFRQEAKLKKFLNKSNSYFHTDNCLPHFIYCDTNEMFIF